MEGAGRRRSKLPSGRGRRRRPGRFRGRCSSAGGRRCRRRPGRCRSVVGDWSAVPPGGGRTTPRTTERTTGPRGRRRPGRRPPRRRGFRGVRPTPPGESSCRSRVARSPPGPLRGLEHAVEDGRPQHQGCRQPGRALLDGSGTAGRPFGRGHLRPDRTGPVRLPLHVPEATPNRPAPTRSAGPVRRAGQAGIQGVRHPPNPRLTRRGSTSFGTSIEAARAARSRTSASSARLPRRLRPSAGSSAGPDPRARQSAGCRARAAVTGIRWPLGLQAMRAPS